MATAEPVGYLLDTHVFIWLASEPTRVPEPVLFRLTQPDSKLFLSVASLWELAIKSSMGKLTLRVPLAELLRAQCEAMALGVLDVTRAHALGVEVLPFHHRDPFDRLLVAQAIHERLVIVSADTVLDDYPVERLW